MTTPTLTRIDRLGRLLLCLLLLAGTPWLRAESAAEEAELGARALEAGNTNAALEHYRAAQAADPGNAEYIGAVTALAEQNGRVEVALAMLRQLVDTALAAGDRTEIAAWQQEIDRLATTTPSSFETALESASVVAPEQADAATQWQSLVETARNVASEEELPGAFEAMQQAIELATATFGEQHWFTLSSYRDLGYLFLRTGQYNEAEQFLAMAHAGAATVLGAGHPQTLEIAGFLAEMQASSGNPEAAYAGYREMVPQYASSLGENHGLTLLKRQEQAAAADLAGHREAAASELQQLCPGFEGVFGATHERTFNCLRQRAAVVTALGKFGEAEAIYDDLVARMGRAFGNVNGTALDVMRELGEIYREQGRYPEAKSLLSGVVATAVQINLPEVATAAKSYIARVFNNEGDYARAEKLTLEVLNYGRTHWQETPLNLYNTLLELGAIYENQGRLRDAEVTYDEAYHGLQQVVGDAHPSTLVALANLGQVYEKEGLYDQAEPALKTALQGMEAALGATHPTTARVRNNLALLHESQGNFREAEPLYKQTLESLGSAADVDLNAVAAVRNNLAYLYMMMEDYEQAGTLFEQVHQDWIKLFGEDHQNTLKALNNLGRVRHAQGRLEEAEQILLQSRTKRTAALGEDHLDSIRSMIDLGSLYLDQGRKTEARDLLQDALGRAERVLGEQHPYTFEALNKLAASLAALDESGQALAVLDKGFARRSEFLDRVLWVTGENAREGYVRLHRPELDRYLALVTRQPAAEGGPRIIDASLQRKGLLLKVTSEIQQIALLSQDPELRVLAEELEATRKQLASLMLSGPTPETGDKHADFLYRLEQKVNELQGRLGRASTRYRSSIANINSGELVKAMEENTVLVDFQVFEEAGVQKLVAGIIRKQGGAAEYQMVTYDDMKKIEQAVLDYRGLIQEEGVNDDELLEGAQDVYDTLWKPIATAVGDVEHVYLIPDGVLNILPFAALADEEGEYLIRSKDLHILTSGRDLLPTGYRLAKGNAVILAGPDYNSDKVVDKAELTAAQGRRSAAIQMGLRGLSSGLRGLKFDPLPGAEEEGRLITSEVDAVDKGKAVYFRQDAQERILEDLPAPPEILHMATHGFFLKADDTLRKRLLSMQRGAELDVPPPGDNPLLRAGLAFAGINTNAPFLGDIDTTNDGVLTALEVLGLNLSGTRLVVLSACETGLGEVHEGEGVYGLRRSFQEAGVAEVISSLWEVSDAGTQALMTAFYDKLLAGTPAREALRASQLELMDSAEWGYPYVWSAFMIVGSYESAGYTLN